MCSFLQWKSNTVCLMFLHYHFNTNIPYSYQTLCYLQSTFLYKRDRIFPTWNIGDILTDPSDIMIDNIHFLQISYRSWDMNFRQASQSQDYVHIRCTFLCPRKNLLKVKYIFLIEICERVHFYSILLKHLFTNYHLWSDIFTAMRSLC